MNTSISRDLEENVPYPGFELSDADKENKRHSMRQWQKSVKFPWK